jgi:Protein of unknown function (DUF1428)
MAYVQGWVVPVRSDKRAAYRNMAAEAAAIWKEHGAVSVTECWGDDVPEGKVTSFPMAVKLEEGETVVFLVGGLAIEGGAGRRDGEGAGGPAHAADRRGAVQHAANDLRRLRGDRRGLIRARFWLGAPVEQCMASPSRSSASACM